MRTTLLPDAEQELQAAAQWYEQRQQGLGEQFLETAIAALVSIERHPRRFAPYAYAPANHEVRRCLLGRFPYGIIYEVRSDELVILAVAHAVRRPGYWRSRLP
mgnify:CR=1 FL=1